MCHGFSPTKCCSQVSAYLNNNPIPGFTPTQIGHPEYNPGLVVVAKNSPVTVMLNEGLQRLRRAGTLSHMLERRLLRYAWCNHKKVASLLAERNNSILLAGSQAKTAPTRSAWRRLRWA